MQNFLNRSACSPSVHDWNLGSANFVLPVLSNLLISCKVKISGIFSSSFLALLYLSQGVEIPLIREDKIAQE
jgi:hypothetical protein